MDGRRDTHRPAEDARERRPGAVRRTRRARSRPATRRDGGVTLVTVSEKRNRRTFDYDEATVRRAAGESVKELAAAYGVSVYAIYRATNPDYRARQDALVYEALKAKRKPCLGCCGRLVWMHVAGRTGYCPKCLAAKGRAERGPNHGSESEYSYGCRCDLCKAASAEAKRLRRHRSRQLCSHGCGTLVDTIDRRNREKPLECRSCAAKRIQSERRAAA